MNDRENESEYGAGQQRVSGADEPMRQPRAAAERHQAYMARWLRDQGTSTPRSLAITLTRG